VVRLVDRPVRAALVARVKASFARPSGVRTSAGPFKSSAADAAGTTHAPGHAIRGMSVHSAVAGRVGLDHRPE
jgi:hypothetical protein